MTNKFQLKLGGQNKTKLMSNLAFISQLSLKILQVNIKRLLLVPVFNKLFEISKLACHLR